MDIDWKLQEANPIREKLARAAIGSVAEQLQEISDQHLVNAKDPQIFIKIKLQIPKECEHCEKEFKSHSIVDEYKFGPEGDMQEKKTLVLCNKCAKKLKLQN